jgi:PIN domain nuclease of toxin-antitoxin system
MLSGSVRSALEEGPCWISVVSYWEIVVKGMKGTLDVGDPEKWWRETVNALSLRILLFRPEHISAISLLPALHQDPFDRALIAQAVVEELTFLTADRVIPSYASSTFRILQ